MKKQPRSNLLEKEVQKFFECGWLLKIISGKYYLCNPRTSNLAYSKEDLRDNSFDTQFDYFNRDEKEGALRILKFIEDYPDIVQDYQKLYPGRIVYSE